MNAPETGPVAAEMLRRLNSALSPARIELVGESEQLRDHGLTFDISATTYYQGITGGGLEEGFEFGGRNDYWLNVDGQKAGLWPGFFVTLHGETVYGDSVNAATGEIGHPSRDWHWRRLDQHRRCKVYVGRILISRLGSVALTFSVLLNARLYIPPTAKELFRSY